eukprot:1651141-Prymnesium_polylepis.1
MRVFGVGHLAKVVVTHDDAHVLGRLATLRADRLALAALRPVRRVVAHCRALGHTGRSHEGHMDMEVTQSAAAHWVTKRCRAFGHTGRSHEGHMDMEVTWRSHGGHMEVTWRSHGGRMEVIWRSHGGRME